MYTNENRTKQERIEAQTKYLYNRINSFLDLVVSANKSHIYKNDPLKSNITANLIWSKEFQSLRDCFRWSEPFLKMESKIDKYSEAANIIKAINSLEFYSYIIKQKLCLSDCCKNNYHPTYLKFRNECNKLYNYCY